MKVLHIIAFILLVIGGINWGLVGLGLLATGSSLNVVDMILGTGSTLSAVVYILVGLSAVWLLVGHSKDCKACKV